MVTIAVLVLALAALTAAIPSAFSRLATREIDQSIAGASATSRYLVARPSGHIVTHPSRDPDTSGLGDLDPIFGTWQDQLADLRAKLPEPLRSRVGAARWTWTSEPGDTGPNPQGDPPSGSTLIGTRTDLHAKDVARLVTGNWPTGDLTDLPVQIAISEASAAALGAQVGSELGGYRVVGLFAPIDPAADYWQLNPGMITPNIFDDGNLPMRITVIGFTGPGQAGITAQSADGARQTDPAVLVWYPLDLSGLTSESARHLVAQLRKVVAAPQPMPVTLPNIPADAMRRAITSLTLTTEVIDRLGAAADRGAVGAAFLVIALSGPAAAALAVLMLAIGALRRRDRSTMALLAARGATPLRLRLLRATAGAVAGIPPALVAAFGVALLFGPGTSATGVVLACAVGILPAALLAAAPIDRGGASVRPDVGLRARSRLRPVIEVAVLLLAAVSVYLLVAGGVGGGPPQRQRRQAAQCPARRAVEPMPRRAGRTCWLPPLRSC